MYRGVKRKLNFNNARPFKRRSFGRRGGGRNFSRRRTFRRRRAIGGRRRGFRVFRNKGRRTYPNQYLILRSNFHGRDAFPQDSHGDFTPVTESLDTQGIWIPTVDQIDAMQLARFNNASTKRIVSIHIYIQAIRYTETSSTQLSVITAPQDSSFFTFASITETQAPIDNHYMISNGVKGRLFRSSAKFHSILKANCNARLCTSKSLADMNLMTWKEFTQESDFFNRTGLTTNTDPRLNIAYLIMPEINSCDTTGITGCLKYEITIATKWRLYQSKT